MQVEKPCPFCGTSESYRFLLESEQARIIYPKNPALQLHFLISPKRHVMQLHQLESSEFLEMHGLLKALELYIARNYPSLMGYNLLSNNGSPSVNQQVPHAHMHVFFRQTGDPDPMIRSKHTDPADFTEEQLALISTLKNSLKRGTSL